MVQSQQMQHKTMKHHFSSHFNEPQGLICFLTVAQGLNSHVFMNLFNINRLAGEDITQYFTSVFLPSEQS